MNLSWAFYLAFKKRSEVKFIFYKNSLEKKSYNLMNCFSYKPFYLAWIHLYIYILYTKLFLLMKFIIKFIILMKIMSHINLGLSGFKSQLLAIPNWLKVYALFWGPVKHFGLKPTSKQGIYFRFLTERWRTHSNMLA